LQDDSFHDCDAIELDVKDNIYGVFCQDDDEAGNNICSVTAGSSRFRQMNRLTGYEREVVRFKVPCFSKHTDQYGLLSNRTKEVFIISGQRDQVDLAVKQFDRFYNDETNHELKLNLWRHPTKKEIQMIRSYMGDRFKTNV